MSQTTLEDTTTHPHKKTSHRVAPTTAKKLRTWFETYKKLIIITASVLVLVTVTYYVFDAFTHEETDDAYVAGHLHSISARINGVVTDVLVNDNQQIKQGDVLVKLDTDEYVALQAAAKAQLDKAKADLDREQVLVAQKAVSPQDLDAAQSTYDTDLAQVTLAGLQIDYSTIKAPADGYVGRKNVEVGNRISSGQTLMDVVEPDLWVVANFKETQLAKMKKDQPATIAIDSIPDKVFTGKIDSFSPATGNEFALLPADNSTGNFTKIVQRVPVKVVFDADSVKGYEDRIRAGESAVVKVALTDPASPAK